MQSKILNKLNPRLRGSGRKLKMKERKTTRISWRLLKWTWPFRTSHRFLQSQCPSGSRTLTLNLWSTRWRPGRQKTMDSKPYNINIVGVHNASAVPNSFDDRIYVFWKYDNRWKIVDFKTTTDPGVIYLRNPINYIWYRHTKGRPVPGCLSNWTAQAQIRSFGAGRGCYCDPRFQQGQPAGFEFRTWTDWAIWDQHPSCFQDRSIHTGR